MCLTISVRKQEMQCFDISHRGRCRLGFLLVDGTVVSKMAALKTENLKSFQKKERRKRAIKRKLLDCQFQLRETAQVIARFQHGCTGSQLHI